jgi:hypothetical protein
MRRIVMQSISNPSEVCQFDGRTLQEIVIKIMSIKDVFGNDSSEVAQLLANIGAAVLGDGSPVDEIDMSDFDGAYRVLYFGWAADDDGSKYLPCDADESEGSNG